MDLEIVKTIKPILDVYDKVREILNKEKVELPKIVVVGDQSSGKSSVLESITRISLPRGENTVTKCPIVIQLRSSSSEEFATIKLDQEEKSYKIPIEDLEVNIQKFQNELITNSNEEITEKPLYLNVNLKGAPDLTLYDLPGITYSKTNLTEKIRNIIRKYTKGENTIILLVLPSNTDLTTSEAIAIIKENLDHKERTIPILTKIDLGITQDKRIYRTIKNNSLDLKHNPIIVRNRTQEELENKMNIEEIYCLEEKLINEHSELRDLPDGTKGTRQLIDTLVQIQKTFLLNSRLSIRDQVLEKLTESKQRLAKLPAPSDSIDQKHDRFKECIKDLLDSFDNAFDCFFSSKNESDELNFSSKLNKLFKNNFDLFLSYHSLFFKDSFHKELSQLISESRGFNLPNFINYKVLNLVMAKQFETMIPKLETNIIESSEIMFEVYSKFISKAFKNYKALKEAILSDIKESIYTKTEETMQFIKKLLLTECECNYTINPYYMDIVVKITKLIIDKKGETGNCFVSTKNNIFSNNEVDINDFKIQKEMIFTETIMKAHLDDEMAVLNMQINCFAYWKVIEKRFVDYLNKIIISNFVFYFKKNLGIILEKKYSPHSSKSIWIDESISIKQERRMIEKSIYNLNSALDELRTII